MNMVKDSKIITHLGSPSQNGKGLDFIPINNNKQENEDGGGILKRRGRK